MPMLLKILLLPVLLFTSNIVFAQDGKKGITDNSASAKDTIKNIYAIIAGVSAYKNLPPLNYADRDAIRFKNFLLSPGGGSVNAANIKMYLNGDVTEGSIVHDCFVWLSEKNISKGDRIYFYLSGHGDGYNDKYFFFTADADTTSGPKNLRLQGNLNIAELVDYLSYYVEKSGAEVFLIIDACRTNEHSDQGDKNRASNFSKISTDKYKYIPNFYTFYSTKDGYPAYESQRIGGGHGLFTYYLVDAMMGKADDEVSGNKDSTVTLFELASWLKTKIPQKSEEIFNAKQMPDYCCGQDDEHVIIKVNNQFKKQYTNNTNNLVSLLSSESYADKDLYAKKGVKGKTYDTALTKLYNSFTSAIKNHRLTGNNSAEYYYGQMLLKAPQSDLTEDAKHYLIIELIDYAQSKINLYLSGEDVGFIRDTISYAENLSNDLNSDSYIKLNKVFLISFGDAADYLDKAIHFIGNNPKVIAKLQPKLLFLRARSYFDKNNHNHISLQQAIQLAEKALNADPDAVHLYHLLAMLQMENKNPKKAGEYFVKAMQGETHWSKANLELGYYYYQLKKYDLANKYYQMAIVTNKNFAYAYNNLGILMQQQKRYDEAEAFYKKAIEKKPGDTILRHNLANFYNEKGLTYKAANDFINAEKYLLKAIQADSNFIPSYLNAGNIYLLKKDYGKAEEYYKKAVVKDSMDITANYNLGILFFNSKNYPKADAYFDRVMLLRPAEDQFYKSAKYYSTEIWKLNSTPDKKPVLPTDSTGKSLYHQAYQYYTDSNYAMAEKLFLLALNKEPASCLILTGLGNLYLQTREPQKAEPYLTTCATAAPDNQRAQLLLGICYEMQNKWKEAADTYLKYYRLNPKNKEILTRMIAVYQVQNNPKMVKKYQKELKKL